MPSGAVNAEILEARSDHVHRGDILILRSNLHRVHPNTSPGLLKSPYVDALVRNGLLTVVVAH